jgi:transcriptional accessory protein Tex/SPT6
MSKTFMKDPREVVKPGDIVRVKVLDVDLARKRIALTLRLDDEVGPRADRAAPRTDGGRPGRVFRRATRHPSAARNRVAAHWPTRYALPAWRRNESSRMASLSQRARTNVRSRRKETYEPRTGRPALTQAV